MSADAAVSDDAGARPRVVGCVAVRMGSERLPGKVMREVAGSPVLGHQLDRLERVAGLDGVVVATTVRAEDDVVADYVTARGVAVARGDADDVLGRLVGALEAADAEVAVLVFGDCPLVDPAIVSAVLARFHTLSDRARAAGEPPVDFVGNDLATTFPPGMEVEVVRVAVLVDAAARVDDPAIREHGTLAVRLDAERYRRVNIEATGSERRPDVALTVDTPEDLAVVTAVLEHLAADGPGGDVSLARILAFLDDHPEVTALNAAVERRWKRFRADA